MLSYYAEGENDVSLKDVLAFFTGADREPTTGFPEVPQLVFLHGSDNFATASTCSLCLRLPTRHHTSYEAFRSSMILSFLGHDGFGVV